MAKVAHFWTWMADAHFPEFGRTGRWPDTREVEFSGLPYLAVYRLHGESVEVLRIVRGVQDWPR